MKKSSTTVLMLMMGVSLALGVQKAAEWIKYTSPEGRYSIALPAAPTTGSQESKSADGEKFMQYQASLDHDSGFFMVGYFDQGPETVFNFDRARDGMVAAIKGTLLNESPITLEGNPGRELKIALASHGTEFLVRARFYDVGERVYMLQFIVPKSRESVAAVESATKFFDSFHLAKTP